MTHLEPATSAGSHTAPRPPRRRRTWVTRAVMLGIVLPGALITWQQIATRPVSVEVDALDNLDQESIGILNRAIRNSSPTMVAFYDSSAFDEYARWYSAHDATEIAIQTQYTEKCDKARSQVWLPPFRGTVREECAILRDASLDQRRGLAFGPVLIEYVRRCATGQERPARQDNPYTEDQWRDLTVVIDEALDVDCDPNALPSAPDTTPEDEGLQNV